MIKLRKYFRRLLKQQGWLISLLLFIAGYSVYIVTDKKEDFFYKLINNTGLFISTILAVQFIHNIIIRRHENLLLKMEINEATKKITENILPSYHRWGFRGFVNNLNISELFDQLQEGDELLWLDTYAPSLHLCIERFDNAIRRGAKIRILALMPDSTIAKLRGSEIKQPGFSQELFLTDLKLFINELSRLVSRHDINSLQVRIYTDLPGIPMYIRLRDGIPVWGLSGFFLSRASENFAHIEWTFAENGMLKYFTEYFNNKWNNAQPIIKK